MDFTDLKETDLSTNDVRKAMLVPKDMSAEMKAMLFKPCVKFAFGPYLVQGNWSDIGDVDPTTSLYKDGFRKLQTIQDIQHGETRAVLLYHTDANKDTAIIIPDRFPSWMWASMVMDSVVIIEGLQLISTDSGLITQYTPNHLAMQSPSEIPRPYTLQHRVSIFNFNIDSQGFVKYPYWVCECGEFARTYFSGNTCPRCHTSPTKYVKSIPIRTISSLVSLYMDTKTEDDEGDHWKFTTGTLIRTFSPPSVIVIDQDTQWNESIELCIEMNWVSISSHYRIHVDMKKDSYQYEFHDTGVWHYVSDEYVSLPHGLEAMGIGAKDLQYSGIWNTIQTIINKMIKFPGYRATSYEIRYRPLDAIMMQRISQVNHWLPDYGFRMDLSPLYPKDTKELVRGDMHVKPDTSVFIVGSSKLNLENSFENTVMDMFTSTVGTKIFLISNYTVLAQGVYKGWSRTKATLAYTIQIVMNDETIGLKVSGMLLRNRDNRWLAKMPEAYFSEMDIAAMRKVWPKDAPQITTFAAHRWVFNSKLLDRELYGRAEIGRYVQNFIDMVEAIGIDTSTLFFEEPLHKHKDLILSEMERSKKK